MNSYVSYCNKLSSEVKILENKTREAWLGVPSGVEEQEEGDDDKLGHCSAANSE